MRRFFNIAAVTVFLTAPALALAAAPRTWEELVNRLVYIMDFSIGTLIVCAIVLYFFGILNNMRKAKDSDTSQMRTFFLWGIIALFVMVSIWGILQILRNTLFSGEGLQPGSSGSGNPCVSFGNCE